MLKSHHMLYRMGRVKIRYEINSVILIVFVIRLSSHNRRDTKL